MFLLKLTALTEQLPQKYTDAIQSPVYATITTFISFTEYTRIVIRSWILILRSLFLSRDSNKEGKSEDAA